MSKELKRVKFGADGQLYVGDHPPTVMTGNNVKWADDVKYLKILMHSMASADYLGNEGDIEFLDTLPITQAEFHSLSSEVKNRYVNIMKSYEAHFEERADEILADRDGKGDILEERFMYITDEKKVFSKKEFEDFKSKIMQGITKQSDVANLNAELRNAHNLIKVKDDRRKKEIAELRQHYRVQKGDSVKIWTKNPTKDEMINVIDNCRFKNGRCNNTKVGKYFTIDGETALAWIQKLGLSEYAYNPKHLK